MIDKTRLKALLGDDDSMVRKFLDIFKTQTPLQLGQLRASIEAEDWEQVANLAHAIKSQCQYLNLEAASVMARRIEGLADARGDLGAIRELATRLEAMLLLLISKELT